LTVTKKDITKNLTSKLPISNEEALKLLNKFINLIKEEAISKKVKLSGFGAFNFQMTPERIGRNPKTKESYIIESMIKLRFLSSNKIKEVIN
tara:strand:+ start:2500 stop:2775 length:276 start_codon:yes stop_codon:yes gene_type:complete